jgi:hypothetical protein
MDKLIIEKILGVDLNVLTSDGEHHTVSFMNLLNNECSSMTVDDECNRIPRYKIDLHLECDGFSVGIDHKRNNTDILLDKINNIKLKMYHLLGTKKKCLDAKGMDYFLDNLIKYIKELNDE